MQLKPDKVPERLGTLYRKYMLQELDLIPNHGRVLDVGGFDGSLLKESHAECRICVDLDPQPLHEGIRYVRADGRFLPFKSQSFDTILAMDVIEHVEDDVAFAKSLPRLLGIGGKLILTTPSLNIRMYPSFLTKWISKKWGHIYRMGYTRSRLIELFSTQLNVEIQDSNANAYRFFYLPMRLMYRINSYITKLIINFCINWDKQHKEGQEGFYILKANLIDITNV